jgi:hypothetical protein
LVLASAGIWVAGSMMVVFFLFLSGVPGIDPNKVLFGAPLLAIVAILSGFEYAVVGAFLVALLSAIAVVVLNERGFFAPWSRTRVRVWALATSLTIVGAIVVSYRSFPAVRSIVYRVLGL